MLCFTLDPPDEGPIGLKCIGVVSNCHVKDPVKWWNHSHFMILVWNINKFWKKHGLQRLDEFFEKKSKWMEKALELRLMLYRGCVPHIWLSLTGPAPYMELAFFGWCKEVNSMPPWAIAPHPSSRMDWRRRRNMTLFFVSLCLYTRLTCWCSSKLIFQGMLMLAHSRRCSYLHLKGYFCPLMLYVVYPVIAYKKRGRKPWTKFYFAFTTLLFGTTT